MAYSLRSSDDSDDQIQSNAKRVPHAALLITGDVVAVLAFAAVGRASHHEAGNVALQTIGTAMPFIAGWAIASRASGAFTSATFARLSTLARRTSAAWVVGDAIALAIRSVLERRAPPLAFVIVSYLTVLLLLLGWRIVFRTCFVRSRRSEI